MDLSYLSMFVVAFGAATVLPIQSEILLVGLLLQHEYNPALLVLVASVGNTLGSCVNWYMGRWLRHLAEKPWFPAPEKALAKAERFYKKYGLWSLLLAWTPFLGDPLTIVAGSLRVPFLPFVLMVGAGKAARFLAVTLATLQF
ncbi:YqaA family protein [Oleisolibacter albus]|uniref:YqaA family protein n=1 Tax=Oleisolibacter albus TaxID=2171757 RepID=UPI000DF46709|nr:YqaA family protein [Oleisolibacter albus]